MIVNEIGIDNERMINHLLLENRLISKQKIDHQNKLHEYFNNQQLSDMILIVKKTPVYVHKVVLYARSEFFRQLLETNPNEKLYRIQGDGVEVNLFILLLEYLYSDMFHSISKIPENQRDEFVKMCEENGGEMGQSTKIRPKIRKVTDLSLLTFSGVIPNLFNTVQLSLAKIRTLITVHINHDRSPTFNVLR
jgi:hypothetical protein